MKFEFKNDGFLGLLIPWILYPFLETVTPLFAVIVIFILGLVIMNIFYKKITFYEDKVVINKRFIFAKKVICGYHELDRIDIFVVKISVNNSSIRLHFCKSKSTERIIIEKHLITSFYYFIMGKGIKINSNDSKCSK